MDSLRLEKSYRLIPRELSIEYAALESGLDRFVNPDKGPFIGRDALLGWRKRGFRDRFVTMELLDVTDADARGSEPLLRTGKLIRPCTPHGLGWPAVKPTAPGIHRKHVCRDTSVSVR